MTATIEEVSGKTFDFVIVGELTTVHHHSDHSTALLSGGGVSDIHRESERLLSFRPHL